MLSPTDLQRQTLRLYGELIARSESWAGKLVFTCGEGSSASGLAAAVSIGGGTSLVLDPDPACVKSVFRQGGVDFVVNTLDEALRVLKNEIRRGRPLGVALIAELSAVLAEMNERGVLPDLCIALDPPTDSLFPVAAPAGQPPPGRRHLLLASAEGIASPSPELSAWLTARHWTESLLPSSAEVSLRALDTQILALLPSADSVRRTWIERIPHYQRPAAGLPRLVWLQPDEQV